MWLDVPQPQPTAKTPAKVRVDQRVVVGDSVRSQYLDWPHVPEVFELGCDLVIILTLNLADREQPVARHVQDCDKVSDLHVVVVRTVTHPPVPTGLILDIRKFIALRPQVFETAEILTLVPSPTLAKQSFAQLVKQEPSGLLRVPAGAHGPIVQRCFLLSFGRQDPPSRHSLWSCLLFIPRRNLPNDCDIIIAHPPAGSCPGSRVGNSLGIRKRDDR